ncbi:MAG: tripartite tricarboxylate transporter TctB family protein [Hyphomicrobiales bacterium]|nr:tripartite tricarboxylate transporter TctB family protein [Hyphomicrobiales bacterium]
MTRENIPFMTIAGGAVAVLSAIAFIVLINLGYNREIFGFAGGIAWLGLLAAVRPLVDRRSMSACWFAFALLAFFIFFVDQTYEYEGRVRLFPLLIGYMGIFFSVLDILSLTTGRVGEVVTRSFGRAFDPTNLEGRKALREIFVIGAICLIVLSIYVLGFLVTAPLAVVVWMTLAGRKPLLVSLATGAGAFVFVWVLFELVLRYELYRGIVWELIRG